MKVQKAKDEYKVGDVLDPQGKTNMVGQVTIRKITGNTLKFVDSEGTEYAGMQRSLVRKLVNAGSWKRITQPSRPADRVPHRSRKIGKELHRRRNDAGFS